MAVMKLSLVMYIIHIFHNVNGVMPIPEIHDYSTLHKCILNITKTYAEKRNFIFISEEIKESNFMIDLLTEIDGPRKFISTKNLSHESFTYQDGFFIFFAQKNRFYNKVLEHLAFLDNTRFLLLWIQPDATILQLRSIFQEFWSYEKLDVVALVQLRSGGFSVYTYFPYSKTQCADSGTPIMIDTWSKVTKQFIRKVNLYSIKNKVYNLYGCPLKCAGAHKPPDSMIEETGNKTYNLSGVGGLLFETISVKMNFTPIITRVVDITSNYDTIFTNDSSTLSIEVGTNKVDIGFGIFTRLLDYHPKISFVKETNLDCFTWAVPRNAGAGPSMWATYIGEFSTVTWCLIVISIIFAIPILYFLTHLTTNERPIFKDWVFLSCFVYFTFLGASVEEKPQSTVVRMFLAPWLFYCLVLGAAYNAQLGSYATVPAKAGNIEDTGDLLHTDFSITGAPQMFHVLNASINSSQDIKMLLKRFEVLPPGNFLQIVEKIVVKRSVALFSTKGLLSYCNDKLKAHSLPPAYIQPNCVLRSPTSPLIVRTVSPLREPLAIITHRLFEAGILRRWEIEAKVRSFKDPITHEAKLYLEQMQGAFLLLLSGLLLSVAVFIGELIVHRWICPSPDLLTVLVAQGGRPTLKLTRTGTRLPEWRTNETEKVLKERIRNNIYLVVILTLFVYRFL